MTLNEFEKKAEDGEQVEGNMKEEEEEAGDYNIFRESQASSEMIQNFGMKQQHHYFIS
jgi:hypothetical protein